MDTILPDLLKTHNSKVSRISSDVRAFYDRQQPYRLYHGSTNSTRASTRQRSHLIDTSTLNTVLSINQATLTAIVEPNVPMDGLVAALLPHGLVPPVVMEFPGITVGGGFAGTAGESSSFRHGLFDQTISGIEMVLADGQVVWASEEQGNQYADLFRGAASSFGTLGVTTALELMVVPAKKYVETSYVPVTGGLKQAVEMIVKLEKDASVEYLDGIMFSKTHGVLVVGKMVNRLADGVRVQGFSKARDPWFYMHAECMMQKSLASLGNAPAKDAIPITDYFFRYDRGGFWVGKYAYEYFITPFNAVTRWALDYCMHTRVMYHALHKSGLADINILQDVAVPYAAAVEFAEFLDDEFGHYPLWICPLKVTGELSHSVVGSKTSASGPGYLLNFGVWGPSPKGGREKFVSFNRKLEKKVHESGGRKWLYAQAFFTEAEFWEIYDRRNYEALRAKYKATYLPTVFDKVKTDFEGRDQAARASWRKWSREVFWSIWPLGGVYGVASAILGGRDYLLPKTTLSPWSGKEFTKKSE